jgi:hypothetical protein
MIDRSHDSAEGSISFTGFHSKFASKMKEYYQRNLTEIRSRYFLFNNMCHSVSARSPFSGSVTN